MSVFSISWCLIQASYAGLDTLLIILLFMYWQQKEKLLRCQRKIPFDHAKHDKNKQRKQCSKGRLTSHTTIVFTLFHLHHNSGTYTRNERAYLNTSSFALVGIILYTMTYVRFFHASSKDALSSCQPLYLLLWRLQSMLLCKSHNSKYKGWLEESTITKPSS